MTRETIDLTTTGEDEARGGLLDESLRAQEERLRFLVADRNARRDALRDMCNGVLAGTIGARGAAKDICRWLAHMWRWFGKVMGSLSDVRACLEAIDAEATRLAGLVGEIERRGEESEGRLRAMERRLALLEQDRKSAAVPRKRARTSVSVPGFEVSEDDGRVSRVPALTADKAQLPTCSSPLVVQDPQPASDAGA